MTAPQPEEDGKNAPEAGRPSSTEEASKTDPTEVALSAIQAALAERHDHPDQGEVSQFQKLAPLYLRLIEEKIEENRQKLDSAFEDLPLPPDRRPTKMSLLQRLANVGLGQTDRPVSPVPTERANRPQAVYESSYSEKQESDERELLLMRDLMLRAINDRLGNPEDHLAFIRRELRSVKHVGS